MRAVLVMAVLISVMSACSKQEQYVYKCEYKVRGKWYNGANYFVRPTQDLESAVDWYKTSEAYADVQLASDSIWFEYYCTYTEWKESK